MYVVGFAQGETPLLRAASTGEIAIAKMLIEAKADINRPNTWVGVTMGVRVRVGMKAMVRVG